MAEIIKLRINPKGTSTQEEADSIQSVITNLLESEGINVETIDWTSPLTCCFEDNTDSGNDSYWAAILNACILTYGYYIYPMSDNQELRRKNFGYGHAEES
jgi:hypothetical protein